jgi:hypothetical protein
MELNNMTPYEKLKSLGYITPQEFCLFPTLILDRLVSLPEITNYPKGVQDHLDYDHYNPKHGENRKFSTKSFLTFLIPSINASATFFLAEVKIRQRVAWEIFILFAVST